MRLVWLTNDHVESLGEVNCHGQRVVWGLGFIKGLQDECLVLDGRQSEIPEREIMRNTSRKKEAMDSACSHQLVHRVKGSEL